MSQRVSLVDNSPVQSKVTALINHVALVIDGSGSMRGREKEVVTVTDELIKDLASKSKTTGQETRISLYVIEDVNRIVCHVYDQDVLRTPSLAGLYKTLGWTPLIDATLKSISDLQKTATLYGDHAFLFFVITDGAENRSKGTPAQLKAAIRELEENWTLTCFVPGRVERTAAISYGFPEANVQVWETGSDDGLYKAADVMKNAVASYYTMRSSGIRGSRNLFSMDLSKLTKSKVQSKLEGLHFGQYRLFDVTEKQRIDEFCEAKLRRKYVVGEGYYQLTDPVKVQPNKNVLLLDRKTKILYRGPEARQLLGLPNHEVRLEPAATPEFDIFIQSTSMNRNLLPGQKVVVL